jgi:hypothetical protein|tara:strand:+ start:78 stop:572 length:495 start_codon:yes stop_codon:yes gene_type:complete
MAHFAKISEENEVLQVLTLADKDMTNDEGVEIESIGQAYLEKHNNWPAHLWIQTSYNTYHNKHRSGDNSKAFRGNYAGPGFIWDSGNQIFWEPKPFGSWVKNTSIAQWESPLGPKPEFTEANTAENQTRLAAEPFQTPKYYAWDETAYQADNSQGWFFVDEDPV